MANPYDLLGLTADSDDETIRRRYLELVKQYPPEQQPEKFAAIRAAYDKLRDLDTRLCHRLFDAGKLESIDSIIEEMSCQSARPRLSLEMLLATSRKA